MKKLFGFVMVGSNDLNKSAKFYDAVFVPLDIKKIIINIFFILLVSFFW